MLCRCRAVLSGALPLPSCAMLCRCAAVRGSAVALPSPASRGRCCAVRGSAVALPSRAMPLQCIAWLRRCAAKPCLAGPLLCAAWPRRCAAKLCPAVSLPRNAPLSLFIRETSHAAVAPLAQPTQGAVVQTILDHRPDQVVKTADVKFHGRSRRGRLGTS
jgi:hypothetical protein